MGHAGSGIGGLARASIGGRLDAGVVGLVEQLVVVAGQAGQALTVVADVLEHELGGGGLAVVGIGGRVRRPAAGDAARDVGAVGRRAAVARVGGAEGDVVEVGDDLAVAGGHVRVGA